MDVTELTTAGGRTVDFAMFDADQHYYEAPDAFTRHIEPAFARRGMQWAEIGGRTRLLVDGRVNRFIPNPLFDPVARPGCLDDYFRGRSSGDDIRSAFGELEPLPAAYRDPEQRLAVMDAQGVESCFMFPTLGVGMEEAVCHDPDLAHAVFRAFNRWLVDDWGVAAGGRIFAAPYLTLLDPDQAVDEARWAVEQGARVVVLRSGPVMHPHGGRSPADPSHDPVWKVLSDAGIAVAFHSGESGYHRYAADWGESPEMEAFRYSPFKALTTGHRPIYDTIVALIAHGLFQRFANLRVATIESGSDWVGEMVPKLAKSYRQIPSAWGDDPVATLRRHVWVSPYYEDDIEDLVDHLGVGRVLAGSDFPHAEGIAEPRAFIDDLGGLDHAAARQIMRDNGVALAAPQPLG